jgi:alkanesulfonate monooxygenase SsuD/methylene tetrahydromethanopterin reductase-like flavin-dependent oxidoreductase (luciferase family)
MGIGAVKLAALEEYVRVVMALLREETIEAEFEGQTRLIRLLNPELGVINTKDPIGLYVAAGGPRARKLTARFGAGWINATADVASAIAALDQMRAAWTGAGQDRDALEAVALTGGVVLAEDEPADSPRAIAQAGPRAAMLLHRAADEALMGLPPMASARRRRCGGRLALARQFGRKRRLSRKPSRASDVRQTRGGRSSPSTQSGDVLPHREGAQGALRPARRSRLRRGRDPDPARPGARDRGLGPDPPRVYLT